MDKRQRQYQPRGSASHRAANGQKHRANDRLSVFLKVVCLLLIINMLFSFYLQAQIGSLRNTLSQAVGNQTTEQDPESRVTSGSVQNEQFSSGGSKVSYGTVGNGGNSRGSGSGTPSQGTNSSGKNTGSDEEEKDYAELCGLSEVEKPMQRSRREVLERLADLAEDSDVIKEIYEEKASYPDKMLEALANNPEMANYVAGYPEMAKRPSEDRKSGGGITEREKEQEYPLFLQWDPRWGYMEYGEYSNVGLAGCGPTCLSMVLFYLLENEELTPDKIARYSMDNGYYVWGTGTAWALLEDYPALYGVNARQSGNSEELMKAALDQGRLIICSMGPGDFTAGGHFIVIYGYDKNGFHVNDPNCVARSRKQWTYEELGRQIKQIWTYGLGSGNNNYDYVSDSGPVSGGDYGNHD